MARRRSAAARAFGGALAGLNEGLQPVLQNQMVMKRQAALQELTSQAQDERATLDKLQTMESGLADRVSKGELDPVQAQSMAERARAAFAPRIRKTMLPPVMDFTGMGPSAALRTAPIVEGIEGAKKPEDVWDEEGILQKLRGMGIVGDSDVGSGEGGSAPFASNEAVNNVLGVRRKRLETLTQAEQDAVTQAEKLAAAQSYGTAMGGESAAQQTAPDVLARDVTKTNTLAGPQANAAGLKAAAEEGARERVYFSNSPQRINEAVNKAMAELGVGEEKEYRASVLAAAKNAAEIRPMLDDLTQTSAKINTREGGFGARITGAVRTVRAWGGSDTDVNHMKQVQSMILRRLAPAFGIRESNVSGFEEQLIKGGIGLSAFSTAAERRTALRSLYDLVEMSPLVAKVKGSEGERITYATSALKMRHDANDQAAQAGASTFLDPITNAYIPVVK